MIDGRRQDSKSPPDSEAATPVYQRATEQIRTAARWLVTTFAAVGGALIAAVPLSDLGKIDVGSSNFWWAIGALLGALIAIATVAFSVSRVFTAKYISFAEFLLQDVPSGRGTWTSWLTNPVMVWRHRQNLSRRALIRDIR